MSFIVYTQDNFNGNNQLHRQRVRPTQQEVIEISDSETEVMSDSGLEVISESVHEDADENFQQSELDGDDRQLDENDNFSDDIEDVDDGDLGAYWSTVVNVPIMPVFQFATTFGTPEACSRLVYL